MFSVWWGNIQVNKILFLSFSGRMDYRKSTYFLFKHVKLRSIIIIGGTNERCSACSNNQKNTNNDNDNNNNNLYLKRVTHSNGKDLP